MVELTTKHYLGHRERLRQRFLQGETHKFPDYELLEILLIGILPRMDVKPLAKILLTTFGSLRGVIHADFKKLSAIPGLGPSSVTHLKVILEICCRLLKEEINHKPILNSLELVNKYCQARMAHLPIEQLRLLFLDKKNQLITDEIHQEGTIDFAPIFPREVIKRALELEASALIMVHNHPSGDPTPSQADVSITKKLALVLHELNIQLHDHLIIGKNSCCSLKQKDLI